MKNINNKLTIPILIFTVLFLTACEGQSSFYYYDEIYVKHYDEEVESFNYFTTTVQIHPHMPEFTITRIVGAYLTYEEAFGEGSGLSFPSPREVSIIIEDSTGLVIQIIEGLTQSGDFANRNHGPSFGDYNFDGYLDMRLMRWQDGAGGLLAQEYFWLWDTEIMEFVLHEQLMEIGHSASLWIKEEEQFIRVHNRYRGGHATLRYEYKNGGFSIIGRGFMRPLYRYTGEQYFATMDARLGPTTIQGMNHYEADITIEIIAGGGVIQEILAMSLSYNNPPMFSWQPDTNSFNPLNFDFHYLGNGILLMSLRNSPGGSMMNDPHYFWLWDSEKSKFVESIFLQELSNFGTLWVDRNSWLGVGIIHSVTRISQGFYVWRSYDFINGEFVLVQTRENAMDFYEGNWRMKYVIHDHVRDVRAIEKP